MHFFNIIKPNRERQVFRDARFRIGIALREAGVHQSDAARDLVANICNRSNPPI